jgi:elongation factor 3
MAAAKENAKSIKVLDELMSKLSVSKSQDETNAAAKNLATFINGPIEEADAPTKYVEIFHTMCSGRFTSRSVLRLVSDYCRDEVC